MQLVRNPGGIARASRTCRRGHRTAANALLNAVQQGIACKGGRNAAATGLSGKLRDRGTSRRHVGCASSPDGMPCLAAAPAGPWQPRQGCRPGGALPPSCPTAAQVLWPWAGRQQMGDGTRAVVLGSPRYGVATLETTPHSLLLRLTQARQQQLSTPGTHREPGSKNASAGQKAT